MLLGGEVAPLVGEVVALGFEALGGPCCEPLAV